VDRAPRWLLTLALAACGSPRPDAFAPLSAAVGRPGSAAVLLGPAPPSPHRLDRIAIALDGALLTDDRRASPPRVLARYPSLPRGEHTLSVRVVVSRPCALLGAARETVELRASRTFVLDGRAAAIEVRVLEDPTLAPEEGNLRVLFRQHGTVADPLPVESRPPPIEDFACCPLAEPARSLCRVHARMAEARRLRDIVWLVCLGEKRQALAEIAADLVELGPSADAASTAARARAQERVEALMQEARDCRGLDMAWVGGSQSQRVAVACEGPDPFDDVDAFATGPGRR